MSNKLNYVPGWGADALIQDAERIKMVAERIQSPARMDGRDLDQELAAIVSRAQMIIANVERIKSGSNG